MSISVTVNGKLAISYTVPSHGGALQVDVRFQWWRGRTRVRLAYADGAHQSVQEVTC